VELTGDSHDAATFATQVKLKRRYRLDSDMIVWRFHDHLHTRKPEMAITASPPSQRVQGQL
jgi:hypothetical protein